jgi:co-chaperonin GroES (HSP10)|tara:strand:- start:1497 stop:1874 length:378 start_codon:yes stop_codon:yes gene_type:complete
MMMSEAEAITEEQLEEMLPLPVGYRVLIALPQVKETFDDTDLVKSSQTLHEEHVMSIIGLVVDMGSQAYADEDRFPTGAWCKVGDYVMFRANSGTRFRVADTEYRLMNDDSIEAVVKNPYGISRA